MSRLHTASPKFLLHLNNLDPYGSGERRADQSCLYRSGAIDAVPKKRGPKTDVLEALLKRVDGLEAQLKEKKEQPATLTTDSTPLAAAATASTPGRSAGAHGDDESGEKQTTAESMDPKAQAAHATAEALHAVDSSEVAVYTPSSNRCARPLPSSNHADTIVRFTRQQLIVSQCSFSHYHPARCFARYIFRQISRQTFLHPR